MDICHDNTHKLSKFATEEDFISNMPDNVITNVLDLLPIQDAVKTGVLSKNWRLKWTLLTELVFDYEFFSYLLGLGQEKKYNRRDIIGRILLHLKGPITKFVLYILSDNKELDYEDIYHWVLFLSRKDCKELTLLNINIVTQISFKFPTALLSCIELKHLKLQGGCFRLLPSFSGFPNLLSLDLCFVSFESYNWVEFVTQCPLLEILKVVFLEPMGEHELNQIVKLLNLKKLYLGSNTFSISKLILPPKLQQLILYIYSSMALAEAGAIKVPTAFLCLEDLKLFGVDYNSDKMVSFVFEMICGSPNMHTLLIKAKYKDDVPPPALSCSYFACSSMGQLQLRSVKFEDFRGSENEVYLIKSLLACSPLLKNISIRLDSSSMVGGADGKFMFANKLLKLHRASPVVEIDLCYFLYSIHILCFMWFT